MWNIFRRAVSRVKLQTPTAPELQEAYFPRTNIEDEVRKRIARRDNLVIFGPARQGKTTLLMECLLARDSIYIECRPDFKRPHLYRLILASLGYSISTERKRKQKADYKIKFGVLGSKMEAGVGGEQERTLLEINVDLKNPSEVAHLISRIPDPPYVILNEFHLLDPATKKNFLFDLAFFAERSEIRFVIVGSWIQLDYLEAIEPAVIGKLHYVEVPFWSDQELRAAYSSWRDQKIANAVVPGILEEFISLSGGNIPLFKELLAMPPMESINVLQQRIVDLVVKRSLRSLEARIEDLLGRREIAFSYKAIGRRQILVANPDFRPIQGAADTEYQHTSINPETGQPFAYVEEVKLDAAGTPQYREKFGAELVTLKGGIGEFVIKRFYDAVQAGREALLISELAADFRQRELPNGIGIDIDKLKAIIVQIQEAQRLAPISPPIIGLSVDASQLTISDRRLYLTMKWMAPDAFEEWFEKRCPAVKPEPRKRANVSAEVPQEELDLLLADANKVALGGRHPSPVVHAARAPPIRKTPPAHRTAAAKKTPQDPI